MPGPLEGALGELGDAVDRAAAWARVAEDALRGAIHKLVEIGDGPALPYGWDRVGAYLLDRAPPAAALLAYAAELRLAEAAAADDPRTPLSYHTPCSQRGRRCILRNMAGSNLFVGTLDLLILKAASWGPIHGYAIKQWIAHATSAELNIGEGVLYPALHRLEKRGLLDEEWGITETKREAKFYRLTAAGRRELERAATAWQRHSAAVNAALAASR